MVSAEEKAEMIRLYEETNLSLDEIGKRFGMSARGVLQTYLPLPKSMLMSNYKTNPSARWTDDQAREIRCRARNGEGVVAIAASLGACREAIASLVYGRSYAYINDDCPPLQVPKHRGGAAVVKIPDDDVVEIRERYHAGEVTRESLAEEFGVSVHTIRQILTGHSRGDLPGPRTTEHNKASHFGKLTEEQVIDIRVRASRGERKASIAKSIGMSADAIQNICCGKSYRHVSGPITMGAVPVFTPEQHLELIRLRSEGMSYRNLRKHFHTSEHVIREWLGKIPEDLDSETPNC